MQIPLLDLSVNLQEDLKVFLQTLTLGTTLTGINNFIFPVG